MDYAIVAARASNGVIGRDADIPWQAKGEQKLFRDITMGGALIMGRKTYESIGRPLPGRLTIIVTRNTDYRAADCQVASNLADALAAGARSERPVFVVGGGDIYAQSLAEAHAVHLTTVACEPEGNVYFPEFPVPPFKLVRETHYSTNIDYVYQYFEKTGSPT